MTVFRMQSTKFFVPTQCNMKKQIEYQVTFHKFGHSEPQKILRLSSSRLMSSTNMKKSTNCMGKTVPITFSALYGAVG